MLAFHSHGRQVEHPALVVENQYTKPQAGLLTNNQTGILKHFHRLIMPITQPEDLFVKIQHDNHLFIAKCLFGGNQSPSNVVS
ncbi:hypothetical protein D3C84_1056170 [compost metagenome]